MSKELYTIVIGSVSQVNACYGIYKSEEQAEKQLDKFRSMWWSNGDPYTGEVIPLNEQDEEGDE